MWEHRNQPFILAHPRLKTLSSSVGLLFLNVFECLWTVEAMCYTLILQFSEKYVVPSLLALVFLVVPTSASTTWWNPQHRVALIPTVVHDVLQLRSHLTQLWRSIFLEIPLAMVKNGGLFRWLGVWSWMFASPSASQQPFPETGGFIETVVKHGTTRATARCSAPCPSNSWRGGH